MERCSGKAAEEEIIVQSVRSAKAPSPESIFFHEDCFSSSSYSYCSVRAINRK